MAKSEKIMISINGELQEAQGEVLEQIKKDQTEQAILEALALEKQQKRVDAITKLGEASGLTTDEINAILNI